MSSFSRAQLQRFAAQGAAQRADLWGDSFTVASTTVTLPISVSTSRERMENFGFRLVTRAVITLPDSHGLSVGVGDTLVQATGGHTWRVDEIIPDIATAARKLMCKRLDA